MSSSSGPMTERLLCSICLDVLNDPVSTPCGHNFCKICLKEWWDNSQRCRCPNCKETFKQRPDLKINTTLRELVDEHKKKTQEKQHEVVCDINEGKQKAMNTEKKTQLLKMQTDVQQMIQDRIKKIEDIKHSSELRRSNTEKEKAASVEVFTDLMRSIERCQSELLEMMEEKQKTAEKQCEDVIKDLEQEITELKKRNIELEQILNTEHHLQLIQVHSSMCSPLNTKNCPKISMSGYVSVEKMRGYVTQLQDELRKAELKWMQQYAVDVTLDPDTAHPKLILSDDKKQVRHGNIRHKLPDNPKRFDFWVSVLGKEGFSSGRFYYEVQVKGKTDWTLGVIRESVDRKGPNSLKPVNGFWTVWLRNKNEYKACAGPSVSLSLSVKPQKVGVFVDYEEGLISFYEVESRSHIYTFTDQYFTEKLYPYFNPYPNNGGKNSAPLIITPVNYI